MWRMRLGLSLVTYLCLLHAANAGPASGMVQASSDTKYVEICNNFGQQSIWVSLSATPVNGVETFWLKGKPIAPHTCYTATPDSAQWNAGRAYIFHGDPKQVADPYSVDGNYQLVEYTFRDPSGSGGTKGTGVGYDFSAVDSLHSGLPVAMEAVNSDGSHAFPYTGNPMDSQYDQSTLGLYEGFQQLVEAGWPYFKKSSDPAVPGHAPDAANYYKIPGGYNLYALANTGQFDYQPGVTRITPASLAKKWLYWIDEPVATTCSAISDRDFCLAFRQSVNTIWQAFLKNASHHGAKSPSAVDVAMHITGFVPFGGGDDWTGIGKDIGPLWTAVASGVPTLDPQYQSRRYPDFSSVYSLDPYVTAVHKNFKLNIYAFSIDDGVGYFDAPAQNKLVVAVGGLHGLPNQKQAQPAVTSPYHLNFGPGWTSVKSCGELYELDASLGTSTPLLLQGSASSCEVSYSDARAGAAPKHVLNFTVTLTPQGLQLSGCSSESGHASDCDALGLYVFKQDNVQGPAVPSH